MQKPPKEKNPAAVALGRLGGIKGGKARADRLTAAQRTDIAKKAAKRTMENTSHKCLFLKTVATISLGVTVEFCCAHSEIWLYATGEMGYTSISTTSLQPNPKHAGECHMGSIAKERLDAKISELEKNCPHCGLCGRQLKILPWPWS